VPIFTVIIGTFLRMLWIIFIYTALFFLGFGPVLISILAFSIGKRLGCNINEAGTDPCIRNGRDWGKILNPMAVVGWLSVVTLPLGVMGAICYTVYLLM